VKYNPSIAYFRAPVCVYEGEVGEKRAKVRFGSLRAYRDIHRPPCAVRASAKNFGFKNVIKSTPLYVSSIGQSKARIPRKDAERKTDCQKVCFLTVGL
jgi:hypothetical protein